MSKLVLFFLLAQAMKGPDSLNPNAIAEQNKTYTIGLNPLESTSFTILKLNFGIQYNLVC